jgi:hypothetical protein
MQITSSKTLQYYRNLSTKYPDRIPTFIARAGEELASIVIGRNFNESLEEYLHRNPTVKNRWDGLKIAIDEMSQKLKKEGTKWHI